MELQLQHTEDGSDTLYLPQLDEHYHSVHGAIQESQHVFIRHGLNLFSERKCVKIFEIGFGTGLNALLSLDFAVAHRMNVDYYAIEKYPLDESVYGRLNYANAIGGYGFEYTLMHEAEWGGRTSIADAFNLTKIKADLTNSNIGNGYDLVYQDAFAPDKQPEMWTADVFEKLYEAMSKCGVLVTYSAKGQVRRNMQAAGFTVERLPGPPGKREMLRACK